MESSPHLENSKILHVVNRCEANDFYRRYFDKEAALDSVTPALGMRSRLRPYFPITFGPTTIFFIEEDDIVIALGECIDLPDKKALGLSYISVDKNNRNRGCAKALVNEIAIFMIEKKIPQLDSSFYTNEGEQYLKNTLRTISDRGLLLLEDGKRYFPKKASFKI